MSKSIIGLVLSIAILAILLTGCSDEPDPIPLRQGPFNDLMKLIPLTEESRSTMWFNDYGLAREANGIQAPAEDASAEDLEEYLRELGSTGLAAGPWISGFTRESMAQLEQKYLGFGVVDVERSILAGEPPYTLEAVSGRFDPETTGASLAACAECDKPEIQEHLGVKFYSWGEDYKPDLKKRLQPPAYDVLGRGGPDRRSGLCCVQNTWDCGHEVADPHLW